MTMKELTLSGRVAVVIGGTSGIGLALTQGLAEGGAHVVPISRRKDMVDQAAGSVESRGQKSLRLTADAQIIDPGQSDETAIFLGLRAQLKLF